MRVHVQSLLPCPVDQAWAMIQFTGLLLRVTPGAKASATLEPTPMPARWPEARVIRLRVPGGGIRTIRVVRADPARHEIETEESDDLVRRWHHLMRVRPEPRNQACYSDTVDIDAGLFTLPVYLLAQYFYRACHRGWRRLARKRSTRPE